MKPFMRNASTILACVSLAFVAANPTRTFAQNAAENRVFFADSVAPLPAQPGLNPQGLFVGTLNSHANDKMEIMFSLAIPKAAEEELEAKVAKGEVVSPESLQSDFAPGAEDVNKLTNWLKGQGFEVTHVTPDRTSVYTKATVDQIEKSLQVKMVRVTRDGLTYNAAAAPPKNAENVAQAVKSPSLPKDVGEGVRAIIGLQPFRRMHKHSRQQLPTGGNRAEQADAGISSTATGPSPQVAYAPPYLIREVLKAYDADNLNVTGAGQKIAILIDTLPNDDDLTKFWRVNQLGVTLGQVEKVNVKGGQLPPLEGEETLDVEWATGIAPGATVACTPVGPCRSWISTLRSIRSSPTWLPTQGCDSCRLASASAKPIWVAQQAKWQRSTKSSSG